MSLKIVQAAELLGDYLYKNYELGIQLCLDDRVCQFINADFVEGCNITTDCEIKPVTLTVFNATMSCADLFVAEQSGVQVQSCQSIIISAICNFTISFTKPIPIYIDIDGFRYNMTQEFDLSTVLGRNQFQQQLYNYIYTGNHIPIVSVTESLGIYTVNIESTRLIETLSTADDFIGTNQVWDTFDKNCTQ